MALKSIEQEWLGFAKMVFAKSKPSELQTTEMKKAFFAGAWAMFCATQEIGEPHVTESEALAFLDARKAECEEFKRRIIAEYAKTN